MTTPLRTSALTFVIALITILSTDLASSPALESGPEPAVLPLSAENQELLDFARSRFALAGIELPDVHVEFPLEEIGCHGYGGVYLPRERIVRICRPSKSTIVHELAHSWVETVLDDESRRNFLDLRGLERWTGGESWDQRGAEHAAEIITWGIMDEDITVRWVQTDADGSTSYTWRLFKLPDSAPAQLIEAYEQLTGDLPALRVLDEPCDAAPEEITSPEARR